MSKESYHTIDEYIALYDGEIKTRLLRLRELIHEEAPEATEKISWQMPTFYYSGNLVHFAVHKSHIGFYPGASGVEHFLPKLKDFKTSKGAIQLPNSAPLPEQLIREIVRFRYEENKK